MENFEEALRRVINQFSMEQDSNTPDFILAKYLNSCLDAYNEAVGARAGWYGVMDKPGQSRRKEP